MNDTLNDERDNALAIAKLEGELRGGLKAVKAEYEAMESRIDASLARMHEDAARREAQSQRWTIGFGIAQIAITIAAVGGGIAILGLLIGLPPAG